MSETAKLEEWIHRFYRKGIAEPVIVKANSYGYGQNGVGVCLVRDDRIVAIVEDYEIWTSERVGGGTDGCSAELTKDQP